MLGSHSPTSSPKPLSIPFLPLESPPLHLAQVSFFLHFSTTPPPVNQEASRRAVPSNADPCSAVEEKEGVPAAAALGGGSRETVFLLRGQRLPHILGQAGCAGWGSQGH